MSAQSVYGKQAVLPAKAKLEYAIEEKKNIKLLDKADELLDKETLKDEKLAEEATQCLMRYKAILDKITHGGCFVMNLTFLQPCDVDDFYHDHFRVGPGSLSAALSDLLITDEMCAVVGGEELMVRVEVRYDDYIRVRRRLCTTGLQRSTSVDNLSAMLLPTKGKESRPLLNSLNLATTGNQDSSFADWATHPCTKQLVLQKKKTSQALTGMVTALKSIHEIAKCQIDEQRGMARYLEREEVTRLKLAMVEREEKLKKTEDKVYLIINPTQATTDNNYIHLMCVHKDDDPTDFFRAANMQRLAPFQQQIVMNKEEMIEARFDYQEDVNGDPRDFGNGIRFFFPPADCNRYSVRLILNPRTGRKKMYRGTVHFRRFSLVESREPVLVTDPRQRIPSAPVFLCRNEEDLETGTTGTGLDEPSITESKKESTTLKHRSFVSEPMTGKSISDVPGIGSSLAANFEAKGIIKAQQIVGYFMTLAGDEGKFKDWVQSFGANTGHQQAVYDAVKEWCDNNV